MKIDLSVSVIMTTVISSVFLASCSWDPENIMDRYYSGTKGIVTCEAVCNTEDIRQDECNAEICKEKCNNDKNCEILCTESNISLNINGYCTISTEENSEITSQEICESNNGTWIDTSSCSIKEQQLCQLYGGEWAAQNILDIGNGQYLRFTGETEASLKDSLNYVCGSYDEILNREFDNKCDEKTIELYIHQRTRHYCPNTAQSCVFAYHQGNASGQSAMCSSCDTDQAVCAETHTDTNGKVSTTYTCVDLRNNPVHCGACDNVCGEKEYCVDGNCISSDCSGEGFTYCGDECVDTHSNTKNCGGCGIACATSQNCNDGVCECPKGWSLNDKTGDELTCVNRNTDITCCGGESGSACKSCLNDQSCNQGICECHSGWSLNEDQSRCVNRKSDNECCGGESGGPCNPCLSDQTCYNGQCQCPDGYTLNKDATNCVNRKTDSSCCGMDCQTCIDIQVCSDGLCECPKGFSINADGSKCVDRSSDPTCCGTDCQKCTEPYCANGICSTKCADDQVLCNGKCLDKDRYHVKLSDGNSTCECDNYCDTDNDPNNGCDGLAYDALASIYKKDCNSCIEGMTECEKDGVLQCVNLEEMHMSGCNQCAENWLTAKEGDFSQGCTIDLLNDPNNCGYRNYKCSAHMYAVSEDSISCKEGKCDFDGICINPEAMSGEEEQENVVAYGNCDNNNENGCETKYKEGDIAFCGSCDNKCQSGQDCKLESGQLRCCFTNNTGCTSCTLQKSQCCEGLNLYRKCVTYVCWNKRDQYQCASSKPDGAWEEQ